MNGSAVAKKKPAGPGTTPKPPGIAKQHNRTVSGMACLKMALLGNFVLSIENIFTMLIHAENLPPIIKTCQRSFYAVEVINAQCE